MKVRREQLSLYTERQKKKKKNASIQRHLVSGEGLNYKDSLPIRVATPKTEEGRVCRYALQASMRKAEKGRSRYRYQISTPVTCWWAYDHC